MRTFGLLSGVVLVCLTARVAAASDVQWLDSIDQAKQVAAQTNRLVLVHFWSNTCMPCSKLEQEVYNIPGVGQQIGAAFVPVKVNVDQFPAVRQQYNIEFVPTDVVLAADGRVVAHRSCPLNRFEYIAGLTQVAASYQTQLAGAYANVNRQAAGLTAMAAHAEGAVAQAQGTVAQAGATVQQAANTAAQVGDRYADYFTQQAKSLGAPLGPVAGPVAGAPMVGAPSVPQPKTALVAGAPVGSVPVGSVPVAGVPVAGAPVGGAPVAGTPAPVTQVAATQPAFGPPPSGPAPPRYSAPAGPPTADAAQAGFQTGIAPPTSRPGSSLVPPVRPDTQPAVEPPAAGPPAPGSPALGSPALGRAGPPTAQQPSSQPPLALDGTCPVELVENEKWVPGDRRWGANHRGKVYLFAGQQQQQKFLSDPERYSPALAGNDPVLARDQGQWIPGRRDHGLFYDDRVFLFSSEETLAQFYRDPLRYAEAIQQMESASGLQR